MTTKGLRTRPGFRADLPVQLSARLARTKRLLVDAYSLRALSFAEAERFASRLRRRYAAAWRAA
jgi:hypothetical protein